MLAEAAGPDQRAAKKMTLYTNTVILLEPYCGTMTEPGLSVTGVLKMPSVSNAFEDYTAL